MTSPPSLKCISLRNPRTRARIETSWRARVVPIGSAMMGTVIRRASTTVTTGGGGTRSAPARGEQPEIVAHAQAVPKASHPAAFGPFCSSAVMIPPHHKQPTLGCAGRPLSPTRQVRDRPENGRCRQDERDGRTLHR